jgi:hypothetical protein
MDGGCRSAGALDSVCVCGTMGWLGRKVWIVVGDGDGWIRGYDAGEEDDLGVV